MAFLASVRIIDITTSAFSKAIGRDTNSTVRHVQAEDHLEGGKILETLNDHSWTTASCRSYITDLAFAQDRIAAMIRDHPVPPKPPPFEPGDPTGVHLLARQ